MRKINFKIVPICVLSALLTFVVPDACALTAKILTLDIPHGQSINSQTDHFSLSIESGFISTKGGFSSIFNPAKSATFIVKSNISFQSGNPQLIEITNTIDDPSSSMNRPLGFEGYVYPDIPGDISVADLTVSVSISTDPIIGQTLTALEKNQTTLPTQIFSSPWLGYAQTLSTLTDVFFGTDIKNTPISAHLIIGPPKRDEYIVLVASDHDGDSNLNNLSASELVYDPQSHTLKYKDKNQAIKDLTYVVFKLGYKPPLNFVRLALGSDAPWATVVNTQLRSIPLDQVNDNKQLQTISNNVLSSLNGLQKFLSTDRIFSNYDRASGLEALAKEKIEDITLFCKDRKFHNCPVNELKQYQRGLSYNFNIDQKTLAIASKAIQLQNASLNFDKNETFLLKPSEVSLGGWRTYLVNNPKLQTEPVNKSVINSISSDIKQNPASYKLEDVHHTIPTSDEDNKFILEK